MNPLFVLPAELTIYSVGSTREALLVWLTQQDVNSGDSVTIDAARVEEIDGAGIQLLGALTAALAQRGLLWHVKDPSLHMVEVCSVLGCTSWFERTEESGAAA